MVVFNREGMIAAENAAIKAGISQERLMENAGTAAARFIRQREDLKDKKVTVVCGKGNNGGDGFVIARKLFENSAAVAVILISKAPVGTGAAALMFDRLPQGVEVIRADSFMSLAASVIRDSDILVDALFGIGFKGNAEGTEKLLIEHINSAEAYVYSVDLPSGVTADSGKVEGTAVKADCTLTFEALKPCHILPPSNAFCQDVKMLKIGIDEQIINSITPVCKVIEKPRLPLRDKNSHKGSCGTMLSICGSYGMPGAAILAAGAALRAGVGKLFAVCPPENYTATAVSVPEAVIILNDIEKDINPVLNYLPQADSVLIGCGIGVSNKKKQGAREIITSSLKPITVDADGINCIYHDIEFIKKVKADVVLTPHAGEMARLTGLTVSEIEQNRIEVASRFAAEYGVYLCLKGANTLVATPSGEVFVNLTGTPGLSSAGSGDVLSGIIASFIAQGLDTLCAVTAAVYFHGLAGEKAAEKMSVRGMLAGDIIKELPYLL